MFAFLNKQTICKAIFKCLLFFKDPLQGTAISRNFVHQLLNSFATISKNPKAKPNWGKTMQSRAKPKLKLKLKPKQAKQRNQCKAERSKATQAMRCDSKTNQKLKKTKNKQWTVSPHVELLRIT